jgi:hypothetical protein
MHEGATVQEQHSATSRIETTESIDVLIIIFNAKALNRENSQLYKSELTLLAGNGRFKKQNTLRLDINDIDSSGLSVLAIYKRFNDNHGGGQPAIELNKNKGGFYIERQLVRAGIDTYFDIRYR